MFGVIIAGVVVFIFSQLADEYVLKPIHKFTILKSEIATSLSYLANIYQNPQNANDAENNTLSKIEKERHEKASDELRMLAARLRGYLEERPPVAFFLPTTDSITNAYKALLAISNLSKQYSRVQILASIEANLTEVYTNLRLKVIE